MGYQAHWKFGEHVKRMVRVAWKAAESNPSFLTYESIVL